jgi:hypothetical protein
VTARPRPPSPATISVTKATTAQKVNLNLIQPTTSAQRDTTVQLGQCTTPSAQTEPRVTRQDSLLAQLALQEESAQTEARRFAPQDMCAGLTKLSHTELSVTTEPTSRTT